MPIAKILKEFELDKNTSLVLLQVTTDVTKDYVAVAIHPSNQKVSYSDVEYVTSTDREFVFTRRALFNGSQAKTLVNPKNRTVLNSKDIELQKTTH